MREARAAEILDGRLVDPVVLAEDEAAGKLGLASGHTAAERGARLARGSRRDGRARE